MEQIKQPKHYTYGNIEAIDYIMDKGFNFALGNVIKYVTRAGRKTDNALEDLLKAREYLDFEIRRYEHD